MGLVEEYLGRLDRFPDTHVTSLGVEVPWYVTVAPKTHVVGQVDRILVDGTLCEWKTKGAPKIKKDGTPYVGQDEDSWLEEIGKGPQLATYVMGGYYGSFIGLPNHKWSRPFEGKVLVRACINSNPPDIWPSKPEKGIFTFTQSQVDPVYCTYQVIGEMIRAAHKSEKVPWAIPGMQCENKYRKVCPHLAEGCSKQVYPATPVPDPATWDPDDPGYKVAQVMGWNIQDPELVILSYSSYTKFIECPERFRREWGGQSSEDTINLDIGTVYHAGLASIYRQLM